MDEFETIMEAVDGELTEVQSTLDDVESILDDVEAMLDENRLGEEDGHVRRTSAAGTRRPAAD